MPSDKRVVALRLDDRALKELEHLAASQQRSLGSMAALLVRAALDAKLTGEGGGKSRGRKS